MTYALDLTKRHFVYKRGPMLAIGTWVKIPDDDHDSYRQCLVLIRAGDEFSSDLIPCVVTIDQAYLWDERTGDGAIAAQTAAGFCEAMRFTVDPHNVYMIARTIHDLLGDLLSIPPWHSDEVLADILVTNTQTGKSFEGKLVDV
jgi:hypothetical protein